MNFNDKDEVTLIRKHLDSNTFINYGISLAWIETIRKYIEHLEAANENLTEENNKLTRQLEPFKEKQCFTCSFYGIGDDHMPCYACRDYDKYKWLGDDIHIGDRVGTIKGRGVVSVTDGDTVTVDLDGDHGSYLFFKKDVWEITEDNTKQ